MTRFPGATWRGPVPNQGGAMGPIRGLVLHIQEGSEAGTDSWFHNPTSKVSAHFGNPKSGPLDQWVEVGTIAWAEVDGNTSWISIENEGHSGDVLTASQLENLAQLLAWLHTTYGVPLAVSDTPASGTPGLTGHGLGGTAWGGHYDCPGTPILAARPAIIARAGQLLGITPTTGVPDMGMTPDEDNELANLYSGMFRGGPSCGRPVPPGTVVNGVNIGGKNDLFSKLDYAISLLETIATRPAPAPVVDVAALATQLAPLLNAGATPEAIAQALPAHLTITVGSK